MAPARAAIVAWLLAALGKSTQSRYMRASVVYLIYTSLIMYINLQLAPSAAALYSDDYYSSSDSSAGS
jgi:hypothetical protein